MTDTTPARPNQGDGPDNHTGSRVPDGYDDISDLMRWLDHLEDGKLAWLVEQLDTRIRTAKKARLRDAEMEDILTAATTARILLRRRLADEAIREARDLLRSCREDQ